MSDFKSHAKHKIEQLKFYLYLLNPLIPRKYRVCRSFSRGAHLHYDFLEKSQWWSPSELEAYQSEKVQKLITHAYETVPYYRELFKENKIHRGDIKTVKDLEKIPILTKKIIRKNFPNEIVSQNIDKNRIIQVSTGGSTGEPLVFYTDVLSQDIAWAAYFRFFKWMGYEWGDRIAYFWRISTIKKENTVWYKNILNKIQYSWVSVWDQYDAFRMGDRELAVYVECLIRTRPQILRGYVNSLVALARYCKERKISAIRPKSITTTAEVLYKKDRELLESQFKCSVYDQYAGGECLAVSTECECHDGLHINSEHCVVEIVDEKDNVLQKDSRGRIIVTDLDNFVMPFIRYENGDFGSIKSGRCECGRNLPLMNHVEGRVFGMLKGRNGRLVHGEFFSNLLEECGWYKRYGVENFEVVQASSGALAWYIVCEKHPRNYDKEFLISQSMKYFGNITIDLKFVSSIPLLPSGKRSLIRAQVRPSEI